MAIKTENYADFRNLTYGGPAEQMFHYEGPGYFVSYARTITVVSSVTVFTSTAKPATYSTDFASSVLLSQPLWVI